MKNIIMDQEDGQFEPFSSLLRLSGDFGNFNVICALAHLLAVEVEEDRCCVTCPEKSDVVVRAAYTVAGGV
jgi:hypothetical protein